MSERRRVAIRSVGIVTGYGEGLQVFADGLRLGRTAGASVREWPAHALLVRMAAQVPGDVADVDGFVDDRKVSLLALALAQVGAAPAHVPSHRRGVFLGTGLSSVTPTELAQDVYPFVHDGQIDRAAATQSVRSDRVAPWRHLPARATSWLAQQWGAEGPGGTSFSACAASAEAIAAGTRAIERGQADVVLVGGHDAMVHPLGMLSFQALGALGTVARPFDRRRDGFMLGEGAALLCLQAADQCPSPLGFICGSGSSMDAHGVTAPHPQGLGAEAAMRRALADAGLQPSDIDWVNAHATATPVGDRAELAAIGRVFDDVAVSSLKGAVGHCLAAAGVIEVAGTLAGYRYGFTPGTVGCEQPEDGARVLTAPRTRAPGLVLSNSFGFGGQNVSLVLAPGAA